MWGLLKRKTPRQDSQKGTTAVEMALIAPVVFLLLMGTVEMSLLLLTQHLLESATYNASRLGKTGYVTAGLTQDATVKARLMSALGNGSMFIDTAHVTFSAASYSSLGSLGSGSGTAGYGSTGDIVVYTVSYPWKLFTPLMAQIIGDNDGYITLSARMVVKNEPY